jgi:hypothetical protein
LNPFPEWSARATGMRPKQVGFLLLAALVLALALLRFLDVQSAPFISDEPEFQMMIDQHLSRHSLPTHALWGTRGVVYGPTALWLYLPVRLFTDSVPWIVGYHAFFQCLGFLLLFLVVRSSLGAWVALWTLVLVVASPYLFFYARLPWDNTFLVLLVPVTLLFLARLGRDPSRIGSWVGLGFACGLVFDLHLMALPVILAAWGVALPLLGRARRARRAWIGSVAAVLTMVATMAPYLRELVLGNGSQLGLTKEALTHALPETFLGTGMFLSSEGMEYFLQETMAPVRASLGPLLWADHLAWAVRVVGWGALAWSLGRILHSYWKRNGDRHAPLPVVVRYGVVYFVFLLLYYYAVRPYPFHPHYFMSCFWILPLFAARSMVRLPLPLRRGLQAATIVLVVANVAFVLAAHAQIARNQGTRGSHYSSIPSEIEKQAQEICQRTRQDGKTHATIDLSQVPAVQDRQFEWFGSHLRECSGIAFQFSPLGDSRAGESLGVTVSYRSPSPYDASLAHSVVARAEPGSSPRPME